MRYILYVFVFVITIVLIYAAFFHKDKTPEPKIYPPDTFEKIYVPNPNDIRNKKPGKG